MMTKPGITELSKCVDSRYTLVTMAAKRARMIGEELHDADVYDAGADKPVTTAVQEIAEGKVGYVRSEAVQRAEEWEAEKYAAILSLNGESEEVRGEESSEDDENNDATEN